MLSAKRLEQLRPRLRPAIKDHDMIRQCRGAAERVVAELIDWYSKRRVGLLIADGKKPVDWRGVEGGVPPLRRCSQSRL